MEIHSIVQGKKRFYTFLLEDYVNHFYKNHRKSEIPIGGEVNSATKSFPNSISHPTHSSFVATEHFYTFAKEVLYSLLSCFKAFQQIELGVIIHEGVSLFPGK